MKINRRGNCFAILGGLAISWAALVHPADYAPLFKKVSPSVVLVIAFDENNQPKAIGSGFFVGDGKAIATNFHVVEKAHAVAIKTTSGETGSIQRFLGNDAERDLVLLESPIAGPPLKLSSKTPAAGEEIAAFGNPKGLEGTISTGIVSGIRSDEKSWYLQITAPISPGSSGGPIVAMDGAVLGVATFYMGEGQNLNFAMPVGYIQTLLESARPREISELRGVSPKRADVKQSPGVVRVVEASMSRQSFHASIYNTGSAAIANPLILVVYYASRYDQGRYVCKDIPVHYQIFRIQKSVPAKLAVRIQSPTDYSIENSWCHRSEILDYDMEETPGPRIPTLQ